MLQTSSPSNNSVIRTTLRKWKHRVLSRPHLGLIREHLPEGAGMRLKLMVRLWLKPVVTIPMTVNFGNARYFLSSDPLDDVILLELFSVFKPLFFPTEMDELPGDMVVLDVGAHHGAYAVATLTRYPNSHLIAVEPDPRGFKILSKNVRINNLYSRCALHNVAVTDTDGEFLLEQSTEGSWGNTVVQTAEGKRATRICGVTLANIVGSRRIDVVKCNCEGGEYTVIPQLLLMPHLPRLIVLMVHPNNGAEDKLLKSLVDAGYQIRPTCSSQSHPRYVCVRPFAA